MLCVCTILNVVNNLLGKNIFITFTLTHTYTTQRYADITRGENIVKLTTHGMESTNDKF